ncbi:helix-hairpin-helix domain-containing protein [Rhizophagus irregularis DAOM 181602=DAOM 197198]|nr:helix-hairpin-helix domain-containing protein [Rhizophagus irregularis DAOM 181602=DAOM 197198]
MIKAEHEKAEIGYKQFEDSFGSKCPIKPNDKLDANTAKEYELRTIRGIGKAIAFEITLKRKERAFEDENDLYNRVKRIPPEAKTKIEVVKKYY